MRHRTFALLISLVVSSTNGLATQLSETRTYEAMLVAVQEGDLPKVDSLIAKGANVNDTDSGSTFLIEAVRRRHVRIAESLLEHGALPNLKDDENRTALWYAAENGDAYLAKKLLAAKADVNIADKEGETPLMMAARIGCSVDVVKLLVDSGAKINLIDSDKYSALLWSTFTNLREAAYYLIAHGADVKQEGGDGKTSLFYAAANGDVELVKLLLKKGASVDTSSQEGWTPLLISAQSYKNKSNKFEMAEIAKALIDAGANVNAKDKDGKTALALATENKNEKMVQILKDAMKRK